jgi:hypothetical protein
LVVSSLLLVVALVAQLLADDRRRRQEIAADDRRLRKEIAFSLAVVHVMKAADLLEGVQNVQPGQIEIANRGRPSP